MARVIRYGQKATPESQRGNVWSDEEILRAYWEMEEAATGKPSPLKRAVHRLNIPDLKPQPLTREQRDQRRI